MRRLSFVVLAESVVLAALASCWWMGSGSHSTGTGLEAPPQSRPEVDPAAALIGGGGTRETPVAAVRAAVTDSGVASAGTVTVHGRLLTEDGSPPSEANVSFRQHEVFRPGQVVGVRYAVAGLTAGSWQASVRADGWMSQTLACLLTEEPLQAIDLTLRRAQRVAVFLRTPEGGSLHAALANLHLLLSMTVAATSVRIERDLPATESSSVGSLDAGRYRMAQGRRAEGAADGELQLDLPAPVHATLLLRNLVLARDVIVPGQATLTFTVDPRDVLGRLATVRMRIVDAASGQPLPEARIDVGTAQGTAAAGRTDADGRFVAERILPGIAALEIFTKEYAGLRTQVRVPGGGTLDMGDLALHRPTPCAVRVVDAAGRPVDASLHCTPLDSMTSPRELFTRHTWGTDGDGEATLSLGAVRYVVVARTEDGQTGHAVLDGAKAGPCTIRVAPAVAIHVVAAGDPLAGYLATVRDGDGVPIAASRIEPRWREQTLLVPPGDYTLEVHDDDNRLVKSEKVMVRRERLLVEVR